VAYTHAIQHESVNALQLRLSFGKLLQTDLFSVLTGDVDNLSIDGVLRRDVFLPQRLKESSRFVPCLFWPYE
jgi:hypothetical protein